MTDAAQRSIPPLSPYIVCKDAAGAIDFYVAAFGARVQHKLLAPDGKVFHAALTLNDGALLMIGEEAPHYGALSPVALKGTPVTLHLAVADCDASVKRAADAGATVAMPPSDMFWGDRYGQVIDPFGHRWSFGHKLRDMTPEDIQAAAAKMFANAPGCDETKGG